MISYNWYYQVLSLIIIIYVVSWNFKNNKKPMFVKSWGCREAYVIFFG